MTSYSVARLKVHKRAIIDKYSKPSNLSGFLQAATTLVPLGLLWYATVLVAPISYWLLVPIMAAMLLFLMRVFMMMHECGHGTLCRTRWITRTFGYIFGVVSGLPTYVWGAHHAYHHSTNGDWEKYRGALNIKSVEEYEALTDKQKRAYARERSKWVALVAGLHYLVLNPRYTWMKGSIQLLIHVAKRKIAEPRVPVKTHAATFTTRYWASSEEYWHMFWNNLGVSSAWVAMSIAIETGLFFAVYLITMAFAGACSIILFTVQHNFEHSYGTDTKSWDFDTAAIYGTSFLDLPRWLNWFTANIAFHHVHHLSAAIPNYWLERAHQEYQHLFTEVRRIRLHEVIRALDFILWDNSTRQIVSIAEHEQRLNERAPA